MSCSATPLFPNSVVSNDLDFITLQDPHVFERLDFSDRKWCEMPDKRHDDLNAEGTFVFGAYFSDGTQVDILAHPDFDTVENAERHVLMIAEPLGRLPRFIRLGLSHVVLHDGDETAFSEDLGRFFVLYSENVKTRLRDHDIEETLFHESVHATLDANYAESAGWEQAQRSDGAYITRYAADNPKKEDLAESALFAHALLRHPARLPDETEQAVRALIPNRLGYLETLFDDLDNIATKTDRTPTCW
ncbi:MAG: hypothetical protein ACR2RF_15700 [Geminicoccaceae bacterium]